MSDGRAAEPFVHLPRRIRRRRLRWRDEAALLLLPTATVLGVFGLVDAVTNQRLLFASLAASAFLIYLDPLHTANSIRTLAIGQLSAAAIGFTTAFLFGHGYLAGATAMLATIAVTSLADAVYPPAVVTSLAFSLQSGADSNLVLFTIAVGITALLVVLEHGMLRLILRLDPPETPRRRGIAANVRARTSGIVAHRRVRPRSGNRRGG
jgi:CBS-domain-containing membrane protein